jgi:hypothetical protein
MWDEKDIFNYPTLQYYKRVDLSEIILKKIYENELQFFSGTPEIVEYFDNYLINMRWINYSYNEDGSKTNIPNPWISLNSRFLVDSNFERISKEVFLEEDFFLEASYPGIGLEDVRIIQFENCFYYNSTYFDSERGATSTSSDVFLYDDNNYQLKRNIILPTLYDTNTIKKIEKNWSLFIYNNELCVVYQWYPLQIGKIDYKTQLMTIFERKDVPDYFKEARGTSGGYSKDNEIWFVVHKAQNYNLNNRVCYNYQHFFAIFDLNMNLLRFSEAFKLGDCKVEFCTGLIIKEAQLILSYSLLDTQSIIAVYDLDYINNSIKWYNE